MEGDVRNWTYNNLSPSPFQGATLFQLWNRSGRPVVLTEMNDGSVNQSSVTRVWIPIGAGLFLVALAVSAVAVPELRPLHFLQALICVAVVSRASLIDSAALAGPSVLSRADQYFFRTVTKVMSSLWPQARAASREQFRRVCDHFRLEVAGISIALSAGRTILLPAAVDVVFSEVSYYCIAEQWNAPN